MQPPVPENMPSLWNRVDQHSAQIAQMQRDQGRVEGRLDSVESQLNRFQISVMEKLDRMEAKQDKNVTDMRELLSAHSNSLSQAEGAKKTFMWISATGLSVIIAIVAIWNAVFGG